MTGLDSTLLSAHVPATADERETTPGVARRTGCCCCWCSSRMGARRCLAGDRPHGNAGHGGLPRPLQSCSWHGRFGCESSRSLTSSLGATMSNLSCTRSIADGSEPGRHSSTCRCSSSGWNSCGRCCKSSRSRSAHPSMCGRCNSSCSRSRPWRAIPPASRHRMSGKGRRPEQERRREYGGLWQGECSRRQLRRACGNICSAHFAESFTVCP